MYERIYDVLISISINTNPPLHRAHVKRLIATPPPSLPLAQKKEKNQHSRSQIQQGIPIQLRLIMQKLISRLAVYPDFGHRVLWYGSGIFVASPALVIAPPTARAGMLFVGVFFAGFDELFGVDCVG